MPAMFTPTRIFYLLGAAICGSAAGGYVAWAIASRFARIAELNDRAIVEPHVLIVLCVAGAVRLVEYLRRAGSGGKAERSSWVTRRPTTDDRPGD